VDSPPAVSSKNTIKSFRELHSHDLHSQLSFVAEEAVLQGLLLKSIYTTCGRRSNIFKQSVSDVVDVAGGQN
jgi:hypothetical protein